jgi:hypothetical protein
MEITDSVEVPGAKGLFTTKSHENESIVYVLSGTIFDHPTRESIHIGENKHIYDEYGIFINHSFKPNVRVDGYNLVALRNINAGEEIVFNYNSTEINMSNPFYIGNQIVSGKNNI